MQYKVKQIRDPVYERARWTQDPDKVSRRVTKWRQKAWYDKEVEKFSLSKARVDNEDHLWECTAMLGKGAFGMVGQWTKFDKSGRTLDTIAIKQAQHDSRERDHDGNATVPWEAIIMKGLETQGCRNVTLLRKVRFFIPRPHDRAALHYWRFYIEYYKHGTLHELIVRYKEHNKRYPRNEERLPESFIWQAFDDFAQACYHMYTVRFDGKGPKADGEHFVLHLDLKHENVLLGDAPSDKNKMDYPTLKVADWGLAEYTSMQDSDNSMKWKNYGTIAWCPPEQRDYGRYGQSWRHPVLGNQNHPFSMAHVIWQMGANIFGMMNLDIHNTVLNEAINFAESCETKLRENGYSVLDGYRSSIYSRELTELVEDCLRVDPNRRPRPAELVERTARGLRPWTERWKRTGRKEELRGR